MTGLQEEQADTNQQQQKFHRLTYVEDMRIKKVSFFV